MSRPQLDQLRVPIEDFAQLSGRFHPVLLHHFEKAEDVANARERHAFLPGQALDHLHLADVALRVTAPVGAGAMRLDQPRVFVKHQCARMRLEDLGCHADRVERLVKIAERLVRSARTGATGHYLSAPTAWMMAGPGRTIHKTGKKQPTM